MTAPPTEPVKEIHYVASNLLLFITYQNRLKITTAYFATKL